MKPLGYIQTAEQRLDATFTALGDPTRRAILARLARGESTVLELAQPFAMSQPAISKHLKVLERAGLIARSRDAQRRPCRLDGQALADAAKWLERYRDHWEGNFRRLDALLHDLHNDSLTRRRRKAPHASDGKRKRARSDDAGRP